MRALHLTWLLSRAGGGIPPVVGALAVAQRRAGVEAQVAGIRDPGAPPAVDGGTPVRLFDAVGPLALGWAPRLAADLAGAPPDLLHLHGLFTWPSQAARCWGRRTGRPVVVAPHGMLDPWALANSAWKKRAFRWLVEDDNLRRAACLHALCAEEAAQLRRLGLRNAVAVVPNGVEVADVPDAPDRGAFGRAFPVASGRRVLLFLGRIHPKKGLPVLLDAWADLGRAGVLARDGWLLAIAGPDQLGHRAEVEGRARDLGASGSVLFTGPLYGGGKAAALAAASGFVLPSQSEGLPMAVLEALAWRLPALVSRACNVDVEAWRAGLVFDLDAGAVARALGAFLSLTDAERAAMGARGRAEVERRHAWPRVAAELSAVYGWLLGGGGPPPCVEVVR
ncbi:MAG TPA: glycosyltransferase [Anaeromyxobacteraceae bacterium]|nr:glycosyltransferase [Anaeromyxobacteraceae bacterium]